MSTSDDNSAIAIVPRLTLDGARRIADAAVVAAAAQGLRVSICVCDPAGDPLVTMRMDGAPKFTTTVAAKKAWTAAAAGRPTAAMAERFGSDPALLHVLMPKVPDLLALGGGAPVLVDGRVAGAIGVSGATEAQDQEIADTGVAAVA